MGLTVLIVLVGVGGFIFYLMKNSMNRKATKLLFIGYVAILCLAFAIYELGLSKKLVTIEQSNIVNAEKEEERFYNALFEGRIEEIDQVHIYKEMEVVFPHEQLTLSLHSPEEGFGVSIVVERKKENDDNIDIIYYRTKPAIQMSESTVEMMPITMDWTNDTLTLKSPKAMELKLSLFKKEFPVSQFYGNQERLQVDPTHMLSNEALYLRVPKDLEIREDDNIYISYVGED